MNKMKMRKTSSMFTLLQNCSYLIYLVSNENVGITELSCFDSLIGSLFKHLWFACAKCISDFDNNNASKMISVASQAHLVCHL